MLVDDTDRVINNEPTVTNNDPPVIYNAATVIDNAAPVNDNETPTLPGGGAYSIVNTEVHEAIAKHRSQYMDFPLQYA